MSLWLGELPVGSWLGPSRLTQLSQVAVSSLAAGALASALAASRPASTWEAFLQLSRKCHWNDFPGSFLSTRSSIPAARPSPGALHFAPFPPFSCSGALPVLLAAFGCAEQFNSLDL